MDETPIVLEPITNKTLDKIGTVSVRIRTFGKTNKGYHVYYASLEMVKRPHQCWYLKGNHSQIWNLN